MNKDNKIIYDLYNLGMDPSTLQIEYNNRISKTRKDKEIQTMLDWRGYLGQTITKASGKMDIGESDFLLYLSNGNILTYSTGHGLANHLLTAYIDEAVYNIDNVEGALGTIINGETSYMIIEEEVKKALLEKENIMSGILEAFDKRSKLNKR